MVKLSQKVSSISNRNVLGGYHTIKESFGDTIQASPMA
jgi:hypothetical protein